MAITDPYKTLGVSKNASSDDIKKAYRKMAHQHHPDKKGGDAGKFKEVNEAYQVLSDPQKKQQYDTYGSYSDNAGAGAGGYSYGGGTGGFDFSGFGGFEDIFDMFSGGGRETREPAKGEDLYLQVQVNKKDLGQTRQFEYEVQVPCATCHASGIEPGFKLKTCDTCKGAGQIRHQTRTPFGTFATASVCPTCKGKGQAPEKECHTCKGTARIKGKRTMEIRFPKDIKDGYSIIVPQGGNAGLNNKPAGDLIVSIKVK